MIEKWSQEQALILLAIGLAVMLIEISVLVSTLSACSKIKKKRKSHASAFTSTQTLNPFQEMEHDYGKVKFRNIQILF